MTLAWRGMTPLADPAAVACGQDSAAYAIADGDAGESLRRVLVVESYIGG